jgi:hypothetical protein
LKAFGNYTVLRLFCPNIMHIETGSKILNGVVVSST